MSYQTAISGLDWQMVPSGMIVPSGGIAAMQQYEQGMGAICAGNNVGYINANLTSGDYTGTIADIVYDTIMVTGNIATNRNINLYYNAGTSSGVKRYTVILTPQASSGGPYNLVLTTGVSSKATVTVPIAPSTDTLLSGILQFDIRVDPVGNVSSDAWTVSGSNSNGSWIKFADGTMDEWFSDPVTRTANVGIGFVFSVSILYTYPVAFIGNPPTVTMSVWGQSVQCWAGHAGNSLSTLAIYMFAPTANGTGNPHYHAKGKWRT